MKERAIPSIDKKIIYPELIEWIEGAKTDAYNNINDIHDQSMLIMIFGMQSAYDNIIRHMRNELKEAEVD